MKKVIEVHKYAPELNKLHFLKKGVRVASCKVGNLSTLKDVKECMFKKPEHFYKAVIITITYNDMSVQDIVRPAPRGGQFTSYASIKDALKQLKEKHNAGPFTVRLEFKMGYK